jgi:hypothetical protein
MGKVKSVTTTVIATLLVSSCSSPVVAEKLGSCSSQRSLVVENHISKQIGAISDGNWELAYNYAAASFQAAVSLDQFKRVINRQYLFLIFNDGFSFSGCKSTEDGINQIVLINFQGRVRTLSYDLTLVNDRLGVVAANEITSSKSTAT